jgi:hypothetical protein
MTPPSSKRALDAPSPDYLDSPCAHSRCGTPATVCVTSSDGVSAACDAHVVSEIVPFLREQRGMSGYCAVCRRVGGPVFVVETAHWSGNACRRHAAKMVTGTLSSWEVRHLRSHHSSTFDHSLPRDDRYDSRGEATEPLLVGTDGMLSYAREAMAAPPPRRRGEACARFDQINRTLEQLFEQGYWQEVETTLDRHVRDRLIIRVITEIGGEQWAAVGKLSRARRGKIRDRIAQVLEEINPMSLRNLEAYYANAEWFGARIMGDEDERLEEFLESVFTCFSVEADGDPRVVMNLNRVASRLLADVVLPLRRARERSGAAAP